MTIVKCPRCKKETVYENNPHRPFCSDRCQLLDLGAWAEEKYRVPDSETPVNEKTSEEPAEE